MDINQLQVFQAVVRARSFSKAAAQLYISQPMVTKIIQQLEAELGLRLIERTSKSFSLTDAGKRFYDLSADLLFRFEDMKREIADLGRENAGTVTIVGPPLSLAAFLPQTLQMVRSAFPEIRICLAEGNGREIVEMVQSGRADIGVSQFPLPVRGIKAHPIIQDRCVLIVGENHPLAHEERISFARLRSEKFIAIAKGFPMYETVSELCAQFGFAPDIVCETTLVSFAEKLVSMGEGISILPRPLIDLYRPAGIREIELAEHVSWEVSLIIAEQRYHSDAMLRTLELMLQYFHDPPFDPPPSYPALTPL